jgi:TonB family protein
MCLLIFPTKKQFLLCAVVFCSIWPLDFSTCFAEDAAHISFAEARRITISQPEPRYPAGARSAGMKGEGVFSLHVRTSTGEVERVDVYRSTGHRALDIEAIRALRRWRFRPGIPYDHIRIPINFPGW